MSKYYILVSGRAGVGKSTASNFIKQYLDSLGKSCQIIPFAWGVKRTATEAGWDGAKDQKGRKFLIKIGMAGREYNKDLWAKQAVETTLTAYPDYDIIVSDDWRFPNEGDYIRNTLKGYKVVKLRIESPERESLKGTSEYNDDSEISLPSCIITQDRHTGEYLYVDNLMYNLMIKNLGTLNELQVNCDDFVEHFVK